MDIKPCLVFNAMKDIVVRDANTVHHALTSYEIQWLHIHNKVPLKWIGSRSLIIVSIRRSPRGVYLGGFTIGVPIKQWIRIRKDYLI